VRVPVQRTPAQERGGHPKMLPPPRSNLRSSPVLSIHRVDSRCPPLLLIIKVVGGAPGSRQRRPHQHEYENHPPTRLRADAPLAPKASRSTSAATFLRHPCTYKPILHCARSALLFLQCPKRRPKDAGGPCQPPSGPAVQRKKP
jgi:hypothetical protein